MCVLKDFHKADSESETVFFYRLPLCVCRHRNVSPKTEADATIKMSLIVMWFLGGR